jgi:flagellar motor switch protein FliN/FliY
MSAGAPLEHFARSSAEAVAGVLQSFCGEEARLGSVGVVERGAEPLRGMPAPGVAVEVAYVDGVTGGNVFCLGMRGARRLAAAMMGADPAAEIDDEPLNELELSAVAEAANQMMAAAAQATSAVLGQEIEISPPTTRPYELAEEAVELPDSSAHATTASLTLFGEPCRLVQIVPTAFIVRMTRALDDRALELDERAGRGGDPGVAAAVAATLTDATVRLTAELGRSRMPMARAVGMPAGAIVELDREPDDLIDIYVNGRHLALGRLVISDGGRWAVRVERVLDAPAAANRDARGA